MTAESLKLGTADREIVITRTVDAPRELVFAAWTDPKHVVNWLGPRAFTIPSAEMDVRPGGSFRIGWRDAAGAEHPFKGVYQEVVAPERLVYTDVWGDSPDMEALVTVTFEAQGAATKLTIRTVFPSAEVREGAVQQGFSGGWTEILDRLEEQMVSAEPGLVITRVLNAPRELVFKVWTQAEHLAQWWGPKGFALGVDKLDFRPGGVFLFSMKSPDGFEMWGRFLYRDIVAPERIVWINSFSDPEGNINRGPFSATWPLEVLNVVTLTEQDGKTNLTLRGGPIHVTEEERQTYLSMIESMQQGFGGTFDQLAAYLDSVQ